MLVTNPVPIEDALDQNLHDTALTTALADAKAIGIVGAAITPFVLDRIAEASGGASIPANISLLVNNTTLAARIAGAL